MDDEEIEAAGLPARIAAIALLAAGMLDGAVVLQMLLFTVRLDPWLVTADALFALVGVAQVGCGVQVYGGEFPYTVLGVPVGAAGALLGSVWFVLLFGLYGALSPLPLFAAAASGAAVVTCLVALPAARRISKARSE